MKNLKNKLINEAINIRILQKWWLLIFSSELISNISNFIISSSF